MILKDETLLAMVKAEGRCCWCRRARPTDPHHVMTKGAGQVDIAGNLVPLCRECHTCLHDGNICDFDLLLMAALREGTTQDAIRETVWLIRRIPKGTTDFAKYLQEVEGSTRAYARECLSKLSPSLRALPEGTGGAG